MKKMSSKTIDLRNSIIGFINSNFQNALMLEKNSVMYVGYPEEKPRIRVITHDSGDHLIVQITKDITQVVSDSNSIEYILASRNDFTTVRYGMMIIMNLMLYDLDVKTVDAPKLTPLPDGYAYIVDDKYTVLGTIMLDGEDDDTVVEDLRIVYEGGVLPSIEKFFEN